MMTDTVGNVLQPLDPHGPYCGRCGRNVHNCRCEPIATFILSSGGQQARKSALLEAVAEYGRCCWNDGYNGWSKTRIEMGAAIEKVKQLIAEL